MTTQILAAASPGEVRVAVLRDGDLLDYAIWRPGAPDGVGDLHRGRVTARAPALGGAFVALDGADGFLPDTEGGKDVTEGTVLGMRITRAAQGGKGPRLTARLSAQEQERAGEGEQRLVRRGPGAVERLAALYPQAAVQVDDPALAAGLRQALGQRLSVRMPVVRVPAVRMPSGRAPAGRLPVVGMPAVGVRVLDGDLFGDEALGEGVIGDDGLGDGVFGDDVLRQIEALSQTELVLPNGARLSFHPTPALVAIDVDTGAATGGHMAINREVLPGLARQIRLRNLSGAILLDFAGLPVRRRSALGPALAEALADDHGRPRLLGFTALGLAEIVRPRVHPPLHEMLAGPYAAGLAALRAIAAEAAADPSRMAALRTAPAVATALERDRAALADLARRTGRTLILRSDPSLQGTAWTMEEP